MVRDNNVGDILTPDYDTDQAGRNETRVEAISAGQAAIAGELKKMNKMQED